MIFFSKKWKIELWKSFVAFTKAFLHWIYWEFAFSVHRLLEKFNYTKFLQSTTYIFIVGWRRCIRDDVIFIVNSENRRLDFKMEIPFKLKRTAFPMSSNKKYLGILRSIEKQKAFPFPRVNIPQQQNTMAAFPTVTFSPLDPPRNINSRSKLRDFFSPRFIHGFNGKECFFSPCLFFCFSFFRFSLLKAAIGL